MSPTGSLHNLVRTYRLQRGWAQAELAERAGISRTAVSAIEGERLVPSVATALALAQVFDCTVEELFGAPLRGQSSATWAWEPKRDPCRYWQAQVGRRKLLYPVELTVAGEVAHDGVLRDGRLQDATPFEAEQTLVMACCDPAAGILAAEYARTGFRLIVLQRSSQQALSLLEQHCVHVAGVHLSSAQDADGNLPPVQEKLGSGFQLLRVAEWQEGLAVAPDAGVTSVAAALRSKLTWVGREPGSGARQCLDELEIRRAPRRVAHNHRGVAEAVRCGWADVGVCLRLVSEEANLKFLSIRWESYDLCFSTSIENDPRIKALLATVRSPRFRQLIGDLPGYDVKAIGTSSAV
jgi:molybdate-binding protein/DNA-binding XRE family transcriptional regulator